MAGEFPVAAGYNQVPNAYFIPEVFSLRILIRYYEEALVPQICNFDYEGEIKQQGDKVHIRREPEAGIEPYYIGMGLKQQTIADEEVVLLINKGAYFNIPVNSVQKHQSDIAWWQKVEANAARQHKRYVDKDVLGNIYADAAAANIIVNRTLSPNNLPQWIVDMLVNLNLSHAPDEGRWIVVDYKIGGMFLLNPTFISAEKMGDSQSVIRAGKIGRLGNMEIYQSPNLAVSGGYTQHLYGSRTAVTFATQFVENRNLPNPFDFGDLMQGLQVFGYKTVQPTHLGKAGGVPAA